MGKSKVTPQEQAERDRLWREVSERQNGGSPVHGKGEGLSRAARIRYYDERQKADDLALITKKAVCECGAELAVTFTADFEGVNIHHLRCANGHLDPAVVPQASVYELWRDGKTEVPIYMANQFEKKLRKETRNDDTSRGG